MVKKKIKIFPIAASVRLDEWLLNTQYELADISTYFSGMSTIHDSFLNISDLMLFEINYVLGNGRHLLSFGDSYLKGLYSEMSQKTASNVVTINYDEANLASINMIISKYKSIGIEISFSEAVRVAVFEFTRIYNRYPEQPLSFLALLLSLTRPVYGAVSNEVDQKKSIVSAKFPEFPQKIKYVLKKYYNDVPDFLVSNFNKGDTGLSGIQQRKIRLALGTVSNSFETLQEKAINVQGDPIEISLYYIIMVIITRKFFERAIKKGIGGAAVEELYNPYSIFPQSYSPFTVIGMIPFYWKEAGEEIVQLLQDSNSFRGIYDGLLKIAFVE